MKKDNRPLVFIHKGDSPYMAYTLKLAAAFNPDKDVILLGDDANRKYATDGVIFKPYDAYLQTDAAKDLSENFRFISNQKRLNDHAKDLSAEEWVRFVFLRWFAIQGVVEEYGADAFWSFDTDTMIGTRLARHEPKFDDIDVTEQCNGLCLNGYIRRPSLVADYTELMRALFHDEDVLAKEEAQIMETDELSLFTEMKAWRIFKRDRQPHTRRLNEIINGETFDECLRQEHGMAMTTDAAGSRMKELYIAPSGEILQHHLETDQKARVMTINLSWCPDAMFEQIYNLYVRRLSLVAPEKL